YARLREERGDRQGGENPAPVSDSPPPAQAPAEGRTGGEPSAREKVHGRSRSGPSKNRLRRQAELEAAVEQAEAAQAALEEELSAPEAWATAYETAKSQARITAARRAVEAAWAELAQFEESEPATAG
ncbi:MAG: hypothetical protein ACKOTA_01490, partial [Solirubrobacterales bacterium]